MQFYELSLFCCKSCTDIALFHFSPSILLESKVHKKKSEVCAIALPLINFFRTGEKLNQYTSEQLGKVIPVVSEFA